MVGPPDHRRATAPGRDRGGKQTRRLDGIDTHGSTCPVACWPSCDWATCPTPVDVALTEMIVDLMAVRS